MFDSPAWVIYVAVFFLVFAGASALPGSDEARNQRRNLVIAFGSLALYALWSIPATLVLLGLCAAVYLYSQQSRFIRAVSAPLFIAAALAYLAFVKYWGFAADLLEVPWKHHLYVIGISFYVFTLIGYLIETAYRRRPPLTSFWHTTILLGFWPHLAAGPILRLENIREHLTRKLPLTAGALRLATVLIIGGLAKKLFLADNFGTYVNANLKTGIDGMNGLEACATLLGFTAQIYFDFSGYSDIALGTATLLGFRLPANFDHPYRARSLEQFWSRWHISLSTWFRDYLFIPLGGSRRGNLYVNLLVVFVLSGLWHGPATHFLVWGLIHGLALCGEKASSTLLARLRIPIKTDVKYVSKPLRWLFTFTIIVVAWAYFRVDGTQANHWIAKVFTLRSYHLYTRESHYYVLPLIALLPFLAVDHAFRYYRVDSGFVRLEVTKAQMVYAAFMFLLALLFSGSGLPFIYIQF
jgi:alginate O-acetyltransferase complex protein AlgI